ncbi:MAG: hypothetical protein IJV94_01300 [Bacilli bacterium]|nr:hypothetical protein [Bacilli bacterium]
MKKNKALTAAFSVFALTMVSMCAIGGTFAKYADQDSGTTTATVAKWGVNVDVTCENTFGKKYNNAIDAAGTKVVSNRDLNVLAPGTNGSLGSVTITGQPEVMVDVSVSLTLTLTGWEVEGNDYCPLVFTVNETEIKWGSPEAADDPTDNDNTVIDSVAELEYAVESAVAKSGDDIAANTSLNGTYDRSVTWSWPFEGDDVKDSLLGDSASATISAAWSASVTQVD